jgi:formylglycine-generating enzyme required for sulfatase activity
MTDCLAGAAGAESCCVSLVVTGGTYFRSYQTFADAAISLAYPASVSTFRLDKYEVTIGRFRKFIAAWEAGYMPQLGSGKHSHLNGGFGLKTAPGRYEVGWTSDDARNVAPTTANLACAPSYDSPWTSLPSAEESFPMACVNWWEAYAFCIWDGGFLPSEAEWEYAAAGGSAQREYPWGSTPPGSASEYAVYDCYYPEAGGCRPARVGSSALGAGLWGQVDLAGNVMEWTLDWYSGYTDPCDDCSDLSAASGRSVRSGNFATGDAQLRPAARTDELPSGRSYTIGFRCARSP